jgi:hypothetical protein
MDPPLGFSCCDDPQVQTLSLVIGFTFVFLVLWSTLILSPLKHLAVYFHELSHAMAAICTGGKVHGMEVHFSSGEHGGGVTTHSGGMACIITPAGYIGCGLWGMAMIIGAANEDGSLAVTILMAVMFLWGLCQAQNGFMRVLLLVFLALFVGLWCIQHFLKVMLLSDCKSSFIPNSALLMLCTLFPALLVMGTFIALDALSNVWHDTHHSEGSDYAKCAKLTSTNATCCAAIWSILSLVWLVFGIAANLYVQVSHVPSATNPINPTLIYPYRPQCCQMVLKA